MERFRVHLISSPAGYLNKVFLPDGGQWIDLLGKSEREDNEKGLRWQTVFTKDEYQAIRIEESRKGFWLPAYVKNNKTVFEPVEG